MTREVVIVAAVGSNNVIGQDNGLPWRLGSDLRHFRALTLGKPVIMGRKTFESIGKPLPGRATIVVTRDSAFAAEGVEVAHSLADAFACAERVAEMLGADEIIVAGGGEIYAQAMPRAARLEITEVDAAPSGDAVFPAIERDVWSEICREPHPSSDRDEHAFTFVTYRRRMSR